MKAKEIIIGEAYLAKVSGRVVPVRVLEKRERYHSRSQQFRDYWVCRNEVTGRTIEVGSPQRFRGKASRRIDDVSAGLPTV